MSDVTSITSPLGKSKILLAVGILILIAFFVAWLMSLGGAARAVNDVRFKKEMSAESDALCKKWGLAASSEKYAECLADIQSIRAHQWQHFMEDFDSLSGGVKRAAK